MANINRTQESKRQDFKQIEADSWSGIYLPAICAGVVMTIVLLMAVSCSKKDSNVSKISAPVAPAVSSPTPTATAAAPVAETAKKVVKRNRPTNATYVNGTYGVSFSYPRKYSLQASEKQEMRVEAGFAKGGAAEIASVDMPDGLFSETDLSSALLNVSVNQTVTAEECTQFAGTPADAPVATTDGSKTADITKPAIIKLGANEFTEIEQMKGTGEHQSDLKYFRLFKNGACYEFALDVETSRKADEDLAQVDRGKVFRQLEKILVTAKIKDVDLPGVEKPQTVSSSQPVPATETAGTQRVDNQAEKAQVVAPEQK